MWSTIQYGVIDLQYVSVCRDETGSVIMDIAESNQCIMVVIAEVEILPSCCEKIILVGNVELPKIVLLRQKENIPGKRTIYVCHERHEAPI